MFILDDLLFKLPAKGLMGIFSKIAELAETELTDEDRIREDLLYLQILYETDQINEEDYIRKEAEILERLEMAREMKGQ